MLHKLALRIQMYFWRIFTLNFNCIYASFFVISVLTIAIGYGKLAPCIVFLLRTNPGPNTTQGTINNTTSLFGSLCY